MDKPEKRIDLNSELGMSRRDLIRRGAIVGGTLLWVAPAIQSMAPKAFAQTARRRHPGSIRGARPATAGAATSRARARTAVSTASFGSGSGLDSPADCQDFCAHTGIYSVSGGAAGRAVHRRSEFCSGTNCDTNTQVEPGTNGAFCT